MMLKNCILILPVSDPAKQVAQIVKQHAQLDYHSAIWLKQQSVGRIVGHIILIQANDKNL
jgi:putative lipoic acid-binding regulatory protein